MSYANNLTFYCCGAGGVVVGGGSEGGVGCGGVGGGGSGTTIRFTDSMQGERIVLVTCAWKVSPFPLKWLLIILQRLKSYTIATLMVIWFIIAIWFIWFIIAIVPICVRRL